MRAEGREQFSFQQKCRKGMQQNSEDPNIKPTIAFTSQSNKGILCINFTTEKSCLYFVRSLLFHKICFTPQEAGLIPYMTCSRSQLMYDGNCKIMTA